MRKLLLMMVCLVVLGGCAEALGAFAYQTIGFITSATEKDIADAAIQQASERQTVDRCRTRLTELTMQLKAENHAKTITLCNKTLDFVKDEKPKLWSRRLADRWRDFDADEPVVPEPKMREPELEAPTKPEALNK